MLATGGLILLVQPALGFLDGVSITTPGLAPGASAAARGRIPVASVANAEASSTFDQGGMIEWSLRTLLAPPEAATATLQLEDGTTEPTTVQEADPSFSDRWYAVATTEDVGTEEPFATRLWGEPIVLYRDADAEVVCVTDLCPHRSAPLSMGEMDGGKLRCFYHGWAFGKDGACVSIPTANGDAAAPGKSFCAKHHAVVERDGLLFVWRGNPLTADPLKLPTRAAAADDADTVTITTTLDYGVDWQPVMASSLGAADLFSFAAEATRASYDAPNVLRGAGAGGALSEERHVVPIAPGRTRVILQQTFAKGGAASALLGLPKGGELLSFLVRNRNYQIALDAYPALQASEAQPPQARDESGRRLIAQFEAYAAGAAAAAGAGAGFFTGFGGESKEGGEAAEQQQQRSLFGVQRADSASGTFGLKRNYVQVTPAVEYAPLQGDDSEGVIASLEAMQQAVAGALVSSPAVVMTYKSVAPAVAASLFGGGGGGA